MAVRRQLLYEIRRYLRHLQPEEILDLPGKDDQRDAGREANGNGVRDVLDNGTEPHHPHYNEEEAGKQGRHGEPVVPVLLDNAVNDDDEGASRPTDLHAASTEYRNQETCDNGGVKPLFGFYTGRDGEGDSERERHDANDHAGDSIAEELPGGIAFAENCYELGLELCSRHGMVTQGTAREEERGGRGKPERNLASVGETLRS